jgi:glycosyltransferase involved in cell wall biosynthesis
MTDRRRSLRLPGGERTLASHPLRVCHVVSAAEGAAWMVDQLRELRDGHGCEVAAIIASGTGGLAAHLRAEGIPFHVANFEFTGPRLALPFRALSLARLFRRHRFDVVQTHLFHAMVLGRVAAWLADVPVRLTMVAGPFHLEACIPRWIDRLTAWMDTALIPSCEYSRELYLRMGISDDRLALIYYGYDEGKFDPERTVPTDVRGEFGWPSHTPLIGMVAYFYPVLPANRWIPPVVHGKAVKGHEDLIRAAPLVLREFPDAKFLLLSSPWGELGQQHLDSLQELVRRLDLQDSVIFTGFRSDLTGILRALDVSVQASLTDNLAGTTESLLMGCPMVATRVGGMLDSVRDGETGVLVNPADPEDLADGILRLLRDPEQARALGQAGRQLMLQLCTLKRTGDDLSALYRSRLIRHGRRVRGYRPWVTAWRALRAVPVYAALLLRLRIVEPHLVPYLEARRGRTGPGGATSTVRSTP